MSDRALAALRLMFPDGLKPADYAKALALIRVIEGGASAPSKKGEGDPILPILRRGATIAEIAKELGISKQYVRVKLMRLQEHGWRIEAGEPSVKGDGAGRPASVYRLIER